MLKFKTWFQTFTKTILNNSIYNKHKFIYLILNNFSYKHRAVSARCGFARKLTAVHVEPIGLTLCTQCQGKLPPFSIHSIFNSLLVTN